MRSRAEDTSKVEQTQKRGGSKSGYLSIKEGKNVFRIAPPHNPEDGALEPRQVAWLYFTDEEGKPSRKPVFNAKLHGGQEKDIVGEYLDFLYKLVASEYSDHKERSKVMAPAIGFQGKDGKYVRGIRPSTDWACYAWDAADEFGTLNLYPDMVDRMEELAIEEDADEQITVDPFSDPELGVNLIIMYDKDGEKGKKYRLNKGSKPRPLTPEQEEELLGQKSLAERFRDVYTTHDFDLALEGLENFGTKYKFGVFDMAEWHDTCKSLMVGLPEPKEVEEKEEKPKAASRGAVASSKSTVRTQPASTKKEEAEESITDEMKAKIDSEYGIDEMDKDALITFIEDMDLQVVVRKADDEESLREKVYAEAAILLDGHIDADTKSDPIPDDEPVSPFKGREGKSPLTGRTVAPAATGGSSLRDIRKGIRGK